MNTTRFIVYSMLLFGCISPLMASEPAALFYRGDMDSKKVTAANGAIVNRDFKKAMLEGAYGQVKILTLREGVHTITGYANSNYTFIETQSGLIAVDTGSNIGQARAALAMIRELTDKPIVAIIYSHHHYTGGAGEYLRDSGQGKIPVFGHPEVEKNLQTTAGFLGPKQQRSVGRILGLYLPPTGPDAALTTPDPHFDDPALNANQHITVNHAVSDGEEVLIDDIKTVFYHAVGDTRDSLIVHFPQLDLVVHNTGLLPVLAPLSTLRGEYYRDPNDLIASIDKLRQLNASYMIPSHGFPISGAKAGFDAATAHRDAYAFIYNQSIRALNQGLSPDEMARQIRLPSHLANHPWLAPTYVDNEYNVRAQYRGLVGWFSGDAADLHPPEGRELAEIIIDGFGGVEPLLERVRQAQKEKKYNLAAKLATYVLAVAPQHVTARQLKADALRAMAQTTLSMQTRNYMLTQALHLEGTINWQQPPAVSLFRLATVESVMATPPGTYLKLLEVKVDPQKSAIINRVIAITFSDLDRSWGIHLRKGIVEVTEGLPDKPDGTLELPRTSWAQIASKTQTLEQVKQSGQAIFRGDHRAISEVFSVFD